MSPGAAWPGAEGSRCAVPPHRVGQRLIGHHPLPPTVRALPFFQPLGRVDPQPPVLPPPAVIRWLGHAEAARDLRDRFPRREHPLRLPQLADDRLGRVPLACHAHSLRTGPNPRTGSGPVLGGQVSPAILARLYAWTAILGRRGIINDWLIEANLIDEPIDLLFNRTAVIIGMVHILLPFMIIILYSTMIAIDRELQDAARSLGASGFQTFRRVFLPLSMPGVYAGVLLVFIISLGFFITPAVLGGGGDITIAIFVQQQVSILNWGVASAMSMVLLVVTIILFFVFNRLFGGERMVAGALRG